jgi:transposase
VTEYSEAFKSKMVQRMMGPQAKSAYALSVELGLSQPTLSRWLRAARSNLGPMSKVPSSPPPPSSPKPRRTEDWSPVERLRVLNEASNVADAELGAFLRREGLHEATLREWREAALEGLSPQRTSRAKQKLGSEGKRVKELEKELRRKDRALAEAAALLILQKKVQALWGDGDDDTEPRSDE